MNARTIQSVGIDIGTTTTQLVFSELRLRNIAGVTQAPRYSITERIIQYASPVMFTPLQAKGTIDAPRLQEMIRQWYLDAGKRVSDIETGAVIITGETLKATNARSVIMGMVAELGDFVVATAGPHLESVLAGRGAGVAGRSLQQPGCHVNIDIGGGTTNYAVFEHGRVVDTACLNVGGRLIETDAQGTILHISDPARPVVQEIQTRTYEAVSDPVPLRRVAERMADMICRVLEHASDALTSQLLQTAPLAAGRTYSSITLSGGVGACFDETGGNPYRFGDMGPLLADCLHTRLQTTNLPIVPAEQTVRATVIGAGAWSLTLSGGTVWAPSETLPLRNVPVALVCVDWNCFPSCLQESMAAAVTRLDLDPGEDFLLSFQSVPSVKYRTVQLLAQAIVEFYKQKKEQKCILISVEDDMGKALGMELHSQTELPLVVIDEVSMKDGDYVDLARPFYNGGVVPLSIKSLAFPSSPTE